MIENTHIVIDNGSGMVKAGFSGEDAPCCVFSAVIGKPKYKTTMICGSDKIPNDIIYIGDDAQSKRGILKLNYPIEHGIVTDWDAMERLWDYTFESQLCIDPETRNIMLTEAPQNPKKNREKMVEIMFERFNVPSTYVALQGVLSLYASGRTSGTVLDIGDGVTHTIPIFDGYCIPHAVNRYDLAGRDVTDYFKLLLNEAGNRFITSSEREIVRDIKEKFCYCAMDYAEDIILFKTKNMTKTYTLPDSTVIKIGNEMFRSGEVLFNPDIIGKEIKGIHHAVYGSIQRSGIDVRKKLFENIVLSGGSTMIKNLDKRLEKELNILKPLKMNNVKIVAPPNRKYSVWLGGSVLSSLDTFSNAWITKKEYEDEGVHIIHQKCM